MLSDVRDAQIGTYQLTTRVMSSPQQNEQQVQQGLSTVDLAYTNGEKPPSLSSSTATAVPFLLLPWKRLLPVPAATTDMTFVGSGDLTSVKWWPRPVQ